MANRYWVGGTASWDGTAGTKWAAVSGGAGGESVPTNIDDVFFDAASVGTVTIATGNTGAKSINCTDFTGTLTGSASISVAGSITLVAGMTFTYTGAVTITNTGTIICAGKSFGNALTINAPGQTVTLGDALSYGAFSALNVSSGTFTTANYTVTGGSLQSTSTTNVRAINLGSSTLNLTGVSTLNFAATNLTFNAGTSQINISVSGTATSLALGGQTFYNVSFTNGGRIEILMGTTSGTFNNLTFVGYSTTGVKNIVLGANITVNGTLSISGTGGNRRNWIRSDTYGICRTITINSAPNLTDVDFRDIIVQGTATPISGTRIGNRGNNRGITFSEPKTVYWNLSAAQNWSSNGWAASSGGSPSANNFPLPQDTAVFDDTGSVTGNITLDSVFGFTGTVDMSARTNSMTLNFGTATTICYGSWINGSGTSLIGLNTLAFSGEGTSTITSAGKTFSCPIIIDAYGGTIELADALSIGAQPLTITNGAFDTKNYNLFCGTFSSNSSTVRRINFGSSTINASGNFTLGTLTQPSTFNAGTSQINLSNTVASLSASNLTFHNVSFTSTSRTTTGSARNISGGTNTFNNVTVTAPSVAGLAELTISVDQIINGTLTVAEASPIRRVFIRSDLVGTIRTLTINTLDASDCDFRDITIAGNATGSSPTRAGDCGGNSNITFPSPKTVYWNLSGTQNWSGTGWATSSGGSPDINNFPLAQDTAVFDDTGSVTETITIETNWNIGTFDASTRTSAMTLTVGSGLGNRSPRVHGNWSFGSGVTTTTSFGSELSFFGANDQTIISNGVVFRYVIILNSTRNTVKLGDAFNSTARISLLANSAFDAVTYNVTIPTLSAEQFTTIKMGSGLWTLTGTGTIINFPSTGISNLIKGTADILLSTTSTSSRTINGNNMVYNKLTIGGTTGSSTLIFGGINTFSEIASIKTVAHTIDFGTTTQTFGKWSVTGTAGNIVTLTGTGTTHILAGPATSGIDYLSIGAIRFAATSPGEFYAGANSTASGTPVAPTFLSDPPSARTLYWVGGTGNWSDTARWSTSSGGSGGANTPTSLDDVVFDSSSNGSAYTATVNTITGGNRCKSLTIAGPSSGNLTFAGSTTLLIHDNITLPATGLTRSYTGIITLSGSGSGKTITTNGVTLASAITLNGIDSEWSLGSAINTSGNLTITTGLFDTQNYSLTCNRITASGNGSRTINLGSSTVTNSNVLTLSGPNLTFNAGTSSITISSVGGLSITQPSPITFYNVTLSYAFGNTITTNVDLTFNNLTRPASIGNYWGVSFSPSRTYTINGTFTVQNSISNSPITLISSTSPGATINAAATSFNPQSTFIAFRYINATGPATPWTSSGMGDAGFNSGITFPASRSIYWVNNSGGLTPNSTNYAASSGGSASLGNFPRPQDTLIFNENSFTSGTPTITIQFGSDLKYMGSMDFSAVNRNFNFNNSESSTVVLYGDFISSPFMTWVAPTTNSTTLRTIEFQTRGSDINISMAGGSFFNRMNILAGGTDKVKFLDAFTQTKHSGITTVSIINLQSGAIDFNGQTITTEGFDTNLTTQRSVDFGTRGVLNITGSGSTIYRVGSNFSVSGTGTISLKSASAKTFTGGSIDYSGITLDQGGTGTLTISGNNTFSNITNTAPNATTIALGATTQNVSAWSASGSSEKVLTITGISSILIKKSAGSVSGVDYLNIQGRAFGPEGEIANIWFAGANSINSGTLGWDFTELPTIPGIGNMFFMFN
jgi:hypothetical protein